MKVSTLENATVVRDASLEAMDALNSLVLEVGTSLPEAENKLLRLAVARAMNAILENLVNPVLHEYPILDVDESTWGDIATARTRTRLAGQTPSNTSGG